MNIEFNELRPSNMAFIDDKEIYDSVKEPEGIQNSLSDLTPETPKAQPEEIIDIDGFRYTSEDLNEDKILKFDAQMRKIKFLEEKQEKIRNEKLAKKGIEKQFLHEMTRRVIMICLDKMGKPVTYNTYDLQEHERTKLQKLMHEYNGRDADEIISEFNQVCKDKLFTSQLDYSKLPVYDN